MGLIDFELIDAAPLPKSSQFGRSSGCLDLVVLGCSLDLLAVFFSSNRYHVLLFFLLWLADSSYEPLFSRLLSLCFL
ncbi:MAG: hypothetical protein ACFFC7_15555 [Candidatus Hermodarchaeota archaeon]